jgi:hypothetical protein
MEQREMNLFDLCRAIARGIGKSVKWLVWCFGEMLKLSFRQWWVVLIVVALCVAAALYYSREGNRSYKVDVVANLNGITNSMVSAEFERLNKAFYLTEQQNLATMLNVDGELANGTCGFETFDVIDLLADTTIDMVDYDRSAPMMDTLYVHVPNMVAMRFRTKQPNRVPEMENAILNYLNTRPYFQSLYETYYKGLEREARFHRDQIEKLDSLTSVFYFSQNNREQMQMKVWESGMVLGRREMALFLEDVYVEMRESEYVNAHLAIATAPVVLQSHFVINPRAVNGPLRMSAIAIVVGWLLGLVVAALIENRKRILAWLQS